MDAMSGKLEPGIKRKGSVRRSAMQIKMILDNQCIEGTAKRTYERAVSRCLRQRRPGENIRKIEDEVEGLRYFLEHVDFGYLRGWFPELSGYRKATVILNIPDKRDHLLICCDGKNIFPKWKQEKE